MNKYVCPQNVSMWSYENTYFTDNQNRNFHHSGASHWKDLEFLNRLKQHSVSELLKTQWG